ncbi:Uncharacterised protein [Bordetella pertussis]|nr:Uncharacterised protein [Bordetella pertussis]
MARTTAGSHRPFSKSSKASLYIAVLLHRLQRRPRPRAIMPRRISRVPPRSE